MVLWGIRSRRHRELLIVGFIIIVATYYYWTTADHPTPSFIHDKIKSNDGIGNSASKLKNEIEDDIKETLGKPAASVDKFTGKPSDETGDKDDGSRKEAKPLVGDSKQLISQDTVKGPEILKGDAEVVQGSTEVVKGNDKPDKDNVKSSSRPVVVRWSKPVEHFPVKKTIQLPTASPKALPPIQFKFEKETDEEQEDRMKKLDKIRTAAKGVWVNYREKAWMHDELNTVTGLPKDPFGGWAATLVDSLDTLYLMGFKDEFEEAVAAVAKIDFAVCKRLTIPVFETTIRYIGGLLGAYDISGGVHKILLDKAAELGEILMGAFDTPNRMPIMYYAWHPESMKDQHRAGKNVALSEFGSLTLEFTRLAQLTKEPKYYDAVDRITDALLEWQTRKDNPSMLPGLFPTMVDLSGCATSEENKANDPPLSGHRSVYDPASMDRKHSSRIIGRALTSDVDVVNVNGTGPGKADHADGASMITNLERKTTNTAVKAGSPPVKLAQCATPQKITASEPVSRSSYVLGALADSTYEYFTKQYLLLGGVEDKYRKLYEKSMDAATDKLLYRANVPGNPDVWFGGSWTAWKEKDDTINGTFTPASEHLTCFIGGMYGMGAKIFERSKDLGIAAKLTEGCVWAYNSTPSGLMPEKVNFWPCKDREDCTWSEKAWWKVLDPKKDERPTVQQQKEMTVKAHNAADKTPFASGGYGDVKIDQNESTSKLDQKNPQNIADKASKSPDRNNAQNIADNPVGSSVQKSNQVSSEPIVDKVLEKATKNVKDGQDAISEKAKDVKDATLAGVDKAKQKTTELVDNASDKIQKNVKAPAGQMLDKAAKNIKESTNDVVEKGKEKVKQLTDDSASSKKLEKDSEKVQLTPNNPQKITDDTKSGTKQENPQKIGDDVKTEVDQKNPQKIADEVEDGLVKRQLDNSNPTKSSTTAGEESNKSNDNDDVDDVDDVDDDDGEDASESKHEAGTPLDYRPLTNGDSNPYKADSASQSSNPLSEPQSVRAKVRPEVPLTHEKYVQEYIRDHRLPSGYLSISRPEYILRPEAIESVWYMYRITGDKHWREVGWQMYKAIIKHTTVVYGNSAVVDVTLAEPTHNGGQESFWMAETLKYFYLLFESEDVVSLDEWVL